MNPDFPSAYNLFPGCLWDTPEYWAKQRAAQKLREARARFAPKRAARNRRNKIARTSRKRSR